MSSDQTALQAAKNTAPTAKSLTEERKRSGKPLAAAEGRPI